jgi:hypothetical protein
MEKVRFDLHLPTAQRLALASLANETGLSSADLVRMGIRFVLRHPEMVSQPISENQGDAR